MDYIEISAKTVNDAITEACQKLGITSDKLEYEVIEEGSAGFLGFNSKKAVIKVKEKVIVESNKTLNNKTKEETGRSLPELVEIFAEAAANHIKYPLAILKKTLIF